MIGLQVGRQRHESNILAAKALDATTAGDTFRICQHNHLKQQARIIGRSTTFIVAVVLIEDAQVEFFIDAAWANRWPCEVVWKVRRI